MSLRDLKIAREEIKIPGNEHALVVFGLSLNDLSELIYRNRTVVSKLYDELVGRVESKEESVAQSLLAASPELVAEAIVLSTKEDLTIENKAVVMSLPFPVQIEALEKIAQLTFRSEDDIKKGIAVATKAMRHITDLVTSRPT